MAGSTFQTNPFDLNKLLDDCHFGTLQLPDFQRSWVWDEDLKDPLILSRESIGRNRSVEQTSPAGWTLQNVARPG